MYQKKQANIDKIRNQISITEIISSFIKLTKKGNNSVGLCPFHDDKHASLTVSEQKHIYKCFSCGNSGDAFTFIKNYLHCSYQEAIAKACEIANLNLDEFSDVKTFIENKNKNANLIEINKLANKYFMMFLDNKENQFARDYLAKRDINDELIKRFDIGFAPDGNIILDLLNNKNDIVKGQKGFSFEEIKKVGLATISQEGNYVPYFWGRITFGIRNEYDEIVAFSARTLKDDPNKYINTPTTEIFSKNETLYNFNNVYKVYDVESIYVLEGFMDVIALHKIGITNAVATMGVAFTKNHINLLSKLPNLKSVILCFDNDDAGQNSIQKTAEIIKPYYDVYVVQYDSEFKDIDEIYTHSKDDAIRNANNIISYNLYLINKIIASHNLNNVVEKNNAIQKIIAILQTYKNDIELYTDIDFISSKLNIDKNIIINAISNTSKKTYTKKPSSINYKKYEVDKIDLGPRKNEKVATKSAIECIEDEIIMFSLANVKYLDKFFEECSRATLDKTNKYLELFDKFYTSHLEEKSINLVNVYEVTDDDAIVGNLVNNYLKLLESMKVKFPEGKVDEIIKSYKRKKSAENMTKQLEVLMQESDPELRQQLIMDYVENFKNNKKK